MSTTKVVRPIAGLSQIDERGTGINWQPSCISRYESLWSILHKLTWLNRSSWPAFKALLARERWKSSTIIHMWSSDWLDIPKLESLGFDITAITYSTPEHYPGFDWFLYSNELRFCPMCIQRGFHSAIFQDPSLSCCPIHQALLTVGCPQCGSAIRYSLGKPILENPYGCPCGYLLWPGRADLIWRAALSESDERLLSHYPKHRHTREALSKIGAAVGNVIGASRHDYLLRPSKDGFPDNIHMLPDTLDIPEWPLEALSELPTTSSAIKRLISRPPARTLTSADVRHIRMRLTSAIEARLYATYRSIKRHLGRLVQKYHQPCISALVQLPLLSRRHATPFCCAWTAAYWIWKERWGEITTGTGKQGTCKWKQVIGNRLDSIVDDVLCTDHLPSYESEEMMEWVIYLCQDVFGITVLNSFIETHRLVSNKIYNRILAPYSARDDYFYYAAGHMSLYEIIRDVFPKRPIEEQIGCDCVGGKHYQSVKATVADIHSINATYEGTRKWRLVPGSHAGMKYELFLRSTLLDMQSHERGRFPR